MRLASRSSRTGGRQSAVLGTRPRKTNRHGGAYRQWRGGVDRQSVDLTEDGDYEANFHFDPQTVGDLALAASIPVLPGEIGKDNNTAEGKLRVVDNKIKVLFIDQEPRWDFRYLLAYLQRDRRLEVNCVLIDGEPDLDKLPDSPFLPDLPQDRDGIFRYEILILGDVNPADLGETRMKLINEWVDQSNGGIIFLAGPKFDPNATSAHRSRHSCRSCQTPRSPRPSGASASRNP